MLQCFMLYQSTENSWSCYIFSCQNSCNDMLWSDYSVPCNIIERVGELRCKCCNGVGCRVGADCHATLPIIQMNFHYPPLVSFFSVLLRAPEFCLRDALKKKYMTNVISGLTPPLIWRKIQCIFFKKLDQYWGTLAKKNFWASQKGQNTCKNFQNC